AVPVPVVEHQVPRAKVAEADPRGRHGRHVGRRPLRERPARVRPGRGDLPAAVVVSTQEPPGDPGAVEPGTRLPAERYRLRRGQPPFTAPDVRIADVADPPLHD